MSDNTNDETNDAAKLLAALKAERTARKEAEGKLKEVQAALTAANAKATEAAAFANPNAEGLAKLVQDSAKALTAKQTGELQARVADLGAQLATAAKSNSELLGKLESRTITDEVREAARSSHVREEAMADVLTMGGLELKLVDGRVQTEDGRDVAAWLEDRKGSSPYWWPLSRGAGARGAGEGTKSAFAESNPFARGSGFNLTKQGELLRSDPEAAKLLQAQATV